MGEQFTLEEQLPDVRKVFGYTVLIAVFMKCDWYHMCKMRDSLI